MKKWMLVICLMFINGICEAADCFDLAGRDYKIDPDLLRAISWKESRYRVNAIGINPVTGYGSGLMQVDSQHFNELARYGIKPEHLTTDPCMNIYTGAYYLAIAFKKWGVSWEAVGAYNAGFRKTERQNQRRLAYASEVYRIYTWIKSSKGIRVSDHEEITFPNQQCAEQLILYTLSNTGYAATAAWKATHKNII